jgi:hypothetical protein
MQCAQVFHREPRPALSVTRCPQIARYASGQTLAAIVDLDKLLPAVVATTHAATLAAGCDETKVDHAATGRCPFPINFCNETELTPQPIIARHSRDGAALGPMDILGPVRQRCGRTRHGRLPSLHLAGGWLEFPRMADLSRLRLWDAGARLFCKAHSSR